VLVVAVWAADIDDPVDVAAVIAHVRAELERDIAAARQQLLDLMDPAEMQDDPQQLESGLAFNAKRAVEQAAAEYRSNVLAMLARSAEASQVRGRASQAATPGPLLRSRASERRVQGWDSGALPGSSLPGRE
jgi:hypothetical protein